MKGSLWSYLLAAVGVVTGAVAVRPRAARIVQWWRERGSSGRWGLVVASTLGVLGSGVILYTTAPELLVRWADDEGVYQPATMLAYLAAAAILLRVAGAGSSPRRGNVRIVAGAFLLLFLEEIDWFGVFGGIVGRIEGTYVGSLHDLLGLVISTSVDPGVVLPFVGVAGILLTAAWRRGHLRPRDVTPLFSRSGGTWLVLGGVLIAAAQGLDLGLVGTDGGTSMFEEVLEASGAVLWLAFGLEVARRGSPAPPGSVPRAPNSGQQPTDAEELLEEPLRS